jgi:pyridoxal phosphate enzyme (YggS family)
MIAEALGAVRRRIDEAARAAGRDPATVKLVAVSKTKSAEAIREAYAAGQRAFGENYAQELESKAKLLADLVDIEWHFIGHLQSNKAKLIAEAASVMHTVDSAMLARVLGRRVTTEERAPLPVLIEVNVSGEPQKHGTRASEISEVMEAIAAEPGLTLRGLMTVPPAGDLELAKKAFETLASLRALHGGVASLPELSMGMSSDLEVAVACGATLVRVGSAIFGAR